VQLLGKTLIRQELVSDVGRKAVGLILGYAKTWRLLLDYDEGKLCDPPGARPARGVLAHEEARRALNALAHQLRSRGEASELFARDRGEGLAALLGNIEQTMFGEPLYKTREERAAHLLYFVIKNHPFSDDNKRSGAFLFLLYLRQEGMRLTLDENGMTALTLLIADSDPKSKDLMVRLVMRQNLESQKKTFIQPFFTTAQLLMAGNETEGLHYGVIETPERYWLRWKETEANPAAGDRPLLRELGQLRGTSRLLEIIHDFMVFDAGVEKTCRHNQYFGVRAAQAHVRRREGGVIRHTQGSGKSLTMVWLAKWIWEHVTNSRVLIITDRKGAGRADRAGIPGGERDDAPRQERRRPGAGAEHGQGMADRLPHPQVRAERGDRRAGPRRLSGGDQAEPAQRIPGQGGDLRVPGRMPPHPVWQAARRDEGTVAWGH